MAISIAESGKPLGETVVKSGDQCEISVNLHNAMHLKACDYCSPPQTLVTGFEVTDDLLQSTEVMTMVQTISSGVFHGGFEFVSGDAATDDGGIVDDDDQLGK